MHKNSSSVKKNSIRREGICLSISTCTNICSDERKWEKGGGGEINPFILYSNRFNLHGVRVQNNKNYLQLYKCKKT